MFEAPLALPARSRPTSMSARAVWRGRERTYYEIEWEERRIWGATAAMIVNLGRRLALVDMKLPDAALAAPRPAWTGCSHALGADEGETRFVGGCVRDTLLGLPVSDVDLATRLAPEEVMRRLEAARIKAVPTGLAHGTVTAVIGGAPVEVTTCAATSPPTAAAPPSPITDDWREDAARRDFTINALSADPRERRDLRLFRRRSPISRRGRVRFIGDPLQRIAEDHLRILRFFRFHARFGAGAPDPAALDACAARANDLMALSRERIADELLKLLGLPDPAPTVRADDRARHLPAGPARDRLAPTGSPLWSRPSAAAGIAPGGDPPARGACCRPIRDVAASVAARLRLSKRLAEAAGLGRRHRARCARAARLPDRHRRRRSTGSCCTARRAPDLAALEGWQRPRLPVGGGDLIAMGLEAGPIVARDAAGDRGGMDRGRLSRRQGSGRARWPRRHVDQALRSSQ